MSLVMVRSSEHLHTKDLELSLSLEIPLIASLLTTLDSVISLRLVDLQRQLPSIQTRSRCCSPSLGESTKDLLSEKSVRVELFPSLAHLEIQTSLRRRSRSSGCTIWRSIYQGISTPHWFWFTICILWWCRSNWCSSSNRASTIQGFWRFRKQQNRSICWIWFTQKTIWCCRICLPSIQTRSKCSSRSLEQEPRKIPPQEKSVKVDYSRHLEKQVFLSLFLTHWRGNNLSSVEMQVLHAQETLLDSVLSENLGCCRISHFQSNREGYALLLYRRAYFRRRRHSEKVEPQASLPSLEQAAILYSHLLSNHSSTLMLLAILLTFAPVHIKDLEPYLDSIMEMRHMLELVIKVLVLSQS